MCLLSRLKLSCSTLLFHHSWMKYAGHSTHTTHTHTQFWQKHRHLLVQTWFKYLTWNCTNSLDFTWKRNANFLHFNGSQKHRWKYFSVSSWKRRAVFRAHIVINEHSLKAFSPRPVWLFMTRGHSHLLVGEGTSTRWEWLILHGCSMQASDRQKPYSE